MNAIARKIAKKSLEKIPYTKKLTIKDITTLLGVEEYEPEHHEKIGQPGVAIGLAWTEVGGCILFIEAILSKGEGKITISGQLGDVMEESAMAAYSYLKANAEKLEIDTKLFKNYDLHLHLTPGATSKDGPSAGITLFTALASLYTQRKVKDKLAMTGELAFRNIILPVGVGGHGRFFHYVSELS